MSTKERCRVSRVPRRAGQQKRQHRRDAALQMISNRRGNGFVSRHFSPVFLSALGYQIEWQMVGVKSHLIKMGLFGRWKY